MAQRGWEQGDARVRVGRLSGWRVAGWRGLLTHWPATKQCRSHREQCGSVDAYEVQGAHKEGGVPVAGDCE
eukprot:172653-Chlamydomonas_euryale.AAC.1